MFIFIIIIIPRGGRGSDLMIAYNYLCNRCLSPLVVSSNPAHGEVYSIQHYLIKFVSDLSVVFYGYSGFLHQKD